MPHTVWNLGDQPAAARVQPIQFIAGIEPARGVVIGRRREPKNMLVLEDAWLEVNDFEPNPTANFHQSKYSLALGKDPLNDALLLPVGRLSTRVLDGGVGATDQPVTGGPGVELEQIFRAQGTMWAAKYIAIDIQEAGAVDVVDVDVHMDWSVAQVDWWTWFISWNRLEASPDGSLTDGERAYA